MTPILTALQDPAVAVSVALAVLSVVTFAAMQHRMTMRDNEARLRLALVPVRARRRPPCR